ncbi:MAG: type II toxin-antitoxin system HicB family antitoxin [Legionella sp.]|nr:type II toxin-antitoxin system HicB family antitoxin [Legionella sp.]
MISYEGESAAAFEDAVDDYLAMCEQENKTPEKPFKGTFNIRVGESLHERAVIAAADRGVKLNEFVKQALEHELRA